MHTTTICLRVCFYSCVTNAGGEESTGRLLIAKPTAKSDFGETADILPSHHTHPYHHPHIHHHHHHNVSHTPFSLSLPQEWLAPTSPRKRKGAACLLLHHRPPHHQPQPPKNAPARRTTPTALRPSHALRLCSKPLRSWSRRVTVVCVSCSRQGLMRVSWEAGREGGGGMERMKKERH